MKILGFHYLQKQHFVALAVILVLASTLFSITALGFLGVYKSFNAYLGEEENIIAIYDKQSRTPFTGLVPTYLAERVSVIDGVLACSPEIVIPCNVQGKSVFLRAVVPSELYKLNPLTITDGEALQLNDTHYALAGKRLAEKLNLAPNDKILVLGALSEQYVELIIKGVYESNTALDDEIISPLYVGQWLRKTSYNQVTLIRAKIDPNIVSPTQIYETLTQEATAPAPPQDQKPNPIRLQDIIPYSRATFNPERLSVKDTQEFMKTYLDKYGMTRETLLILSAAIFLFASATIFTASHTLIRQHKPEITVLQSLGASARTLKLDLTLKTLPLSIGTAFAGTFIAALALYAAQELAQPQVLSHRVQFQPDLLVVAANIILVTLIVAIAIAHATRSLNSK